MRTCAIVLLASVALACGREPGASSPEDTPAAALPAPPSDERGDALPSVDDAAGETSPDRAGGGSGAPQAAEPASPDASPGDSPDADGWFRGEVKAGESLAKILGRRGIRAADIATIAAALKPVMDPATIQPGLGWALRVDADLEWTRLELQPSAVRTIAISRDESGAPKAEAIEAETESRLHDVTATLDSSLWAAVTDAGEDPALVAELAELLASQIDFYTDPRKGDRIALVIEKRYLDDEVVGYGRVRAVIYDGGVGRVDGVAWAAPGEAEPEHYTFEGGSFDRTLLKSPLKFTRVSSGFDAKRMHPVLHRVKGHWGIDYAAPTGTPVWAAADGKIVRRAPAGSAGNLVVLEHDGGFQTYYMHLDRFAKGHAVGDRVKQKEVIGYVGTTGRSTGPHLHFGVKRGGRWVDPASVRSIERPGVPRGQRDRFRRETEELRTRVEALLDSAPDGE